MGVWGGGGLHTTEQEDTFVMDLKCLSSRVPVGQGQYLPLDSWCPIRASSVVSSLTHTKGKGREILLKQNALRNGQERPGISVVAICSAISTLLDLSTM